MRSVLRAINIQLSLLILLQVFVSNKIHAQIPIYKKEFTIPAEGVISTSHLPTFDGGTLMLMELQDSTLNTRHFTLIKMDSMGSVIWWRYLGPGYDYNSSNIVQSPDSGFFIACQGGAYTYTIIKTDKNGIIQFCNRIDLPTQYHIYSFARSMAKNDGGFYIAASLWDASGDLWDVMEIDASGAVVSSTFFNTNSAKTRVYDIDTCGNGDVLLLGSIWASTGGHSPVITRLDSNGNIVWSNAYPGTTLHMIPVDFVRSSGDMIYVASQSGLSVSQAALMKVDENGNELWTLNYSNGSAPLYPKCMHRSSTGDILLSGEQFFLKTDSTGVPVYGRRYHDLVVTCVNELSAQRYQFSGPSFNTSGGIIMTVDVNGNSCDWYGMNVVKTPFTITDSAFGSSIPATFTEIPHAIPYDSVIIQIDTTCQPTAVTESEIISALFLYPNPASELLTITSSQEIKTVEVYNINGQCILSQTPHLHQAELDISFIQPGCYAIRIEMENHVESRRLIIE